MPSILVRGWVNNYPQCSCICVSVGSTVVFRVHRYAWFSSYHSCACLKSLGQFLCPNRNVNHGRSTFLLHQGRAAFSDRFLVVWRCIRGRNTSKTFSTIPEQRFAATGCLRMDRKIQKLSHKCYQCGKRCMRGSLLGPKTFLSESIKKLVQR